MRVPLWIVAGMLASAMFVQAATTPFTFAIQPGPHAVGFRVVLQYDFSRTYRGAVDVAGRLYRGEVARPVQTLIWYPARKSARPTVRFGDYLALFATEENFSPTPDASVSLVRQGEKDFDADPSSSMWAVRDAMEEHGAWPVVIYAPSFTAPAFENADLCEYWPAKATL